MRKMLVDLSASMSPGYIYMYISILDKGREEF